MRGSLREFLLGRPRPDDLKARNDVAGLIRLLHQPGDRRAVCAALAELDGPEAVDGLVDAVRGDGAYLRGLATDALGRLRDPRDLEKLTALLADSDGEVREAAARALVSIGDARAVPSLLAADELWAVRSLGSSALPALLAAVAVPELHRAALEVLTQRPSSFTGDAVPVLVAALRSEVAAVRRAAAQGLGPARDRRAVEPLAALLEDEDPSVVASAAYALAEYGDPRAVEPLVRALRSGSPDAAVTLGRSDHERVVPALVAALSQPAVEVRHAAASALRQRGWSATDDAQRAAFAVATEAWDDAVALGAAAIEPLRVLLGTGDPALRERAAKALTTIGWEPTDDHDRLLLALARGDWDQVPRHGPAGVEALAELVEERRAWLPWGASAPEPPTPVPPEAAETLARLGHPRGVTLLRELLRDARREVEAAEEEHSSADRAYHRASALRPDDMPSEELALERAQARLAAARDAVARASAAVQRHAPADPAPPPGRPPSSPERSAGPPPPGPPPR